MMKKTAPKAIDNATPENEALIASELRYRRLFESAQDGILILDAETGIVVDVNPFLLDLLDYPVEEFVGKAVWELGFFKDIVANRDNFAELQQKEYIRYEDKPLKDSDGRRHDVEFISNVYLVNGRKVIQCNIRDITERKRTKDLIEKLSRFPLENPNPVLRVSAQGVLEYANAAADILLPVLGTEAGGTVTAEWKGLIDKAAAEAHPINFEFQAEDHTFEITAAPVMNHGYVNLYARNITEQKRAEKELLDKTRLLSESQRLGHVGSWMIEADGKVVFSDEMYRMLGVSPDTFDTTMESFIALIHPADRHLMRAWAESCAAGKHPAELEFRIIRPDDTVRVILGRGELALDEKTQTAHMAGSGQDITERKQSEKEREKLQTQLTQAQKMEAVGRLAGGVAHDFNNMLQIILGHVEIVINKTAPDSPISEGLQEIQKAALRSAALTRQLLAFARKQDIAPEILNLNNAAASMLKMIQRLIGEDIKLVWRPGSDLRPVKLDPAQIDQILANLCLNARDAISGAGMITLETGNVTIDANYCAGHAEASPGEYVFLAVSDNGRGMDRETMAHIFEPFFTTKEVDKGTGLGLATVYGIVKQNNGFIHAYSEPGQGTTFRIYLPQVVAEAKPPAETTAAVPVGRGETILLAEDEPSLRKVCSLFLEGLGYNVLTAETSEEALKSAELNPDDIHLLLTDVIMPGMNGRQLAEKIRAIKPELRVLFMSGYTADVIAQRGVLEKDAAFIAKPFSRDDLARKVFDVLKAKDPA